MKEKSLFKVIARKGGLRRTSEIRTPERLLSILYLDDALWTATGVDIEYLSMDKRFLTYLDSDSNSRILCGEARDAIRYLEACHRNLANACTGTTSLHLTDIRDDTAEAQALSAAIRRMHSVMQACSDSIDYSGGSSACADSERERITAENGTGNTPVSLADVELCKRILKNRPVSSDGVVLPDAADNPVLYNFLEEIIRSVGGEPHPGGALGVTIPEIEEFLEEARLRLEWMEKVDQDPGIMILGSDTAAAFESWERVRPGIADYFELDALVSVDPSLATEAAKIPLAAYIRALQEDPDKPAKAAVASRAAAPLAFPDGKGVLSLDAVRDPAHTTLVTAAFKLAGRLLDRSSEALNQMSREDFHKLDLVFAPYRSWLASEGGTRLAHLSTAMLGTLTAETLVASARELVGERGAAALAADDIRTVERFLLFTRDLVPFLNNFVVFPYLYDPVITAAFEAGSFIADGRRFSFSVRVRDIAKHKVSANYSRMYVMYLEVYIGLKAAYRVAVPVTTGSQGRLYKGKHGLFREPDGTERDAVIVDLLENPISTLETLGMPFRKAYKTVASRMEEMSKKAEDRLARSAADRTDAALSAELKAPTTEPATPAAGDQEAPGARMGKSGSAAGNAATSASRSRSTGMQTGAFGGLLAGGSIAIAALGSSFAFISKTLSEMSSGAVLITLGALLAAILVPVLASALFKLAARDLAPLLEASGMAMNQSVRLSRSQARAFTVSPKRMRSHHLRFPQLHGHDRTRHEGP
jgi:hypothetical protein